MRRGGTCVFCLEVEASVEIVPALHQGYIGKQPWPPLVVPSQGEDGIPPIQSEVDLFHPVLKFTSGANPEIIHPLERAQIQPVSVSQSPVDLGVQVVKEIPRVHLVVWWRRGPNDGVHQQIQIGPAATDHEGSLVFDQWTFQGQLRSQHGHRSSTVKLFFVPLFHAHLKNGAQAPTKPSGISAFGDGDVAHGIGIEDREEAKQMAHAV